MSYLLDYFPGNFFLKKARRSVPSSNELDCVSFLFPGTTCSSIYSSSCSVISDVLIDNCWVRFLVEISSSSFYVAFKLLGFVFSDLGVVLSSLADNLRVREDSRILFVVSVSIPGAVFAAILRIFAAILRILPVTFKAFTIVLNFLVVTWRSFVVLIRLSAVDEGLVSIVSIIFRFLCFLLPPPRPRLLGLCPNCPGYTPWTPLIFGGVMRIFGHMQRVYQFRSTPIL